MSASSTASTPAGRPVTVLVARVLALGVAAVVGAAVILSPSVAHAEPNLGTLLLTPAAGTVEDALRMTTSAPCPPGADVSQARIYGPGFKSSGQNLSGMAPGFTSSKTAFSVESQYTLRDTAALTYPPVTYEGTYRISVICRTSKSSTLFGTFTTAITFKDAVNWVTASDPSVPVSGGPTTSLPPASQKPVAAKPTATKSATASPRATPSTGVSVTSAPTSGSTAATPPSDSGAGATTPARTSTAGAGATSEPGPVQLASDASSTTGSANALGAALLGAVGGAALLGGGLYLVNRRRSS